MTIFPRVNRYLILNKENVLEIMNSAVKSKRPVVGSSVERCLTSTDPFIDRDLSGRKPGVKPTVAMRFGPHMYALPFHCAACVGRKSPFYTIGRSRRGAVRGFLPVPRFNVLAIAIQRYGCRRSLCKKNELRELFREISPD